MVWLAIVKAVLPHAGTIINLATPVFTKMKAQEAAAAPPELLERQIEELQSAALRNTTHLKELASHVQDTATALEQAMLAADSKVKRAYTLCYVAIGVSMFATGVAVFAVATR